MIVGKRLGGDRHLEQRVRSSLMLFRAAVLVDVFSPVDAGSRTRGLSTAMDFWCWNVCGDQIGFSQAESGPGAA